MTVVSDLNQQTYVVVEILIQGVKAPVKFEPKVVLML